MKIFSALQIYEADSFTIQKQNITSDVLMERAAEQLFNWLHQLLQGSQVKIHLFCGIGNNGGDGIALARLLKENDYNIAVYVVNYSEKRSKDFLLNLGRLKERKVWPTYLDADSELPRIGHQEIIVDAIFGIGLNRKPEDWVIKLIGHLNGSNAFVLAVDIPSGLFIDKVTAMGEAVVVADHVLSIQLPKLVFFLPQTGMYAKNWELLDIGLDAKFIHSQKTDFELVTKYEVLPFYRPRPKFSHKGTFGHVLVMGGSFGMVGAAQLAARASLVSGAGLVTAYVPECAYVPFQSTLPEVMVQTSGKDYAESFNHTINASAICLGVGLGTQPPTQKAFEEFLNQNKTSLVIDADGLNILAESPKLLSLLPPKTVLTPHPGELKRLIGNWEDDFEKLEKVRTFSGRHDVIVVVKGAHTITFYEGVGYINSTGNPGMATAGSGDVLAGIISGLIAQGYPNLYASIFGVFLHGLAGDITASQIGFEALTASKMIDNLGNAYKELFKRPEQNESNTS